MDYQQEYLDRIKPWLEANPSIQHSFEDFIHKEKVHYLLLKLKKADDSGFDFSVQMHPTGLLIYVEWSHVHFDDSVRFDWEHREYLDESFHVTKCLLSPAMRYREKYSTSKDPYWDGIEYWDGKQWHAYAQRLNICPHWKQRERVLQNRILDIAEFHPLHAKNTNPLPLDQKEEH